MIRVSLWGTRGSLASPGAETARYGGNTSCVALHGSEGTVLVLDAGTGIRKLGRALPADLPRVDILLTHLHMDHIQGLAFFAPVRLPGREVHIWGPASTTQTLRARLARYLSPPLFPLYLRDLESTLHLHELPDGEFEIGEFRVDSSLVCHPDPTVGYRIRDAKASLAYLPDHEPALGFHQFPLSPDWTSGHALADGVNLLIHDAQYTEQEYADRAGFGHSSIQQAFRFAEQAGVERLIPFHHDPAHTDEELDRLTAQAMAELKPRFLLTPGAEGTTIELR